MGPSHGNDFGGAQREAFVAAYESHAEGVYRFCLRRAGSPYAAQEVAQRVFAEAWGRWPEIASPSRPITPWLYTVASHMLSDQRRERRRRDQAVRELGELHPGHADDPCEELARLQRLRALVGSVRSLPAGQRQVVGLCLLNDCSYEAAAAVLRIPVGTVRSRLHRARLNLALAVRAADGA